MTRGDALSTELDHTVEHVIVMGGIMMKQGEAFDTRCQGDVNCIFYGAVSPADLLRIFCSRILRVVNNQIGSA